MTKRATCEVRRRRPLEELLGVALVLYCLGPSRLEAETASQQPVLDEMSIEELMNLEVTSAARKRQSLGNTSAAVYVLTAEDIRRSGATTIPEALRLVPGLQVAQINSSKWAVSARGFNDVFANKMLVLVDGRSLYTPLFAGVFWDAQDILLENVERIEIVRGPGAALWGANAVNGVVNVITRSSSETTGGYVEALLGASERGLGGLRLGGRIDHATTYRVDLKATDRRSVDLAASGSAGTDDFRSLVSGIRLDWIGKENEVFAHGGLRQGKERESFANPAAPETPIWGSEEFSGGHAQMRWTRTVSEDRDLALQFYWDRTSRTAEARFQETRDTFDVDFQQRLPLGRRHDLTWGLSFRRGSDEIQETAAIAATPPNRAVQLGGGFLQDEITLVPSSLTLTVGTKIDWNSYTGVELQPTFRALRRLSPSHSLWAAASRAVRTPSRAEREVSALFSLEAGPGDAAELGRIDPSKNLTSEELVAYELGYRWTPPSKITLDVAAFHNRYSDLVLVQAVEEVLPGPIRPYTFANGARASSGGVEVASTISATSFWTLSGWYSWLAADYNQPADSLVFNAQGGSPRHQAQIRSALDLPGEIRIDGRAHWVSALETYRVDDYLRLDLRLAWRASGRLELSVAAANLLESRHQEFGRNSFWNAGQVRRSVSGKLSWWF